MVQKFWNPKRAVPSVMSWLGLGISCAVLSCSGEDAADGSRPGSDSGVGGADAALGGGAGIGAAGSGGGGGAATGGAAGSGSGGAAGTDAGQTSCTPPKGPLSIVPCKQGYGIETVAGSGRNTTPPGTQIFDVTSLAASGKGSLRECVEASVPRTCVFSVSGVIELTDDLKIDSPYITIAGQTAPPPGVNIHGAGLRIRTDDVLVQHLRIRVGDRAVGPAVNNRDAIAISNNGDPPERIVIDHCSLALSSDETLSVWYEAGDVTIIDSLVGLPLHDSIHVDEGATQPAPHGYGPLLGQWGARVFMARNALVHQYSRNPLSRTRELVFANNVVHNFGSEASRLGGDAATFNSFVSNSYRSGTDSFKSRLPIIVDVAEPTKSRVYVKDLEFNGKTPADPWTIVDLRVAKSVIATTAPTAIVPVVVSSSAAEALVLGQAGAWPAHRDAIDKRVVAEIQTQAGEIINCVEPNGSTRCAKNAGGWPVLAKNSHVLAIPADPHGDVDHDGYTNLEEWLHQLSIKAGAAP